MNKPLYDCDFYAWTQAEAEALRRRSANELDWENLQEEVDSIGRQQKSELRSHYVILLQHLLNWRFQPTRRSRSWRLTIEEQRREIESLLDGNPSLAPVLAEVCASAYPVARLRALRETKPGDDKLPADNPFDGNEAMKAVLEP